MSYSDIPFLIEASSEIVEAKLSNLAKKISGVCVPVNSDQRKKIHIAAVFACNFNNHLMAIADRLLKEESLDINLLKPLIKETINKLESVNPQLAQTGPAVREDHQIIEKHLKELQNKPYEQKLYKLLSDNILRYKQA
jgi:predicted short-subunit dehydrogenase-like oxidoreductase (DUF2520 family)